MGSTSWSDQDYTARQTTRAATGASAFHYDQHVRSTGRTEVHKDMNPLGVKVRESRDSADHPTSRAIAVIFDVTGSMGEIPKVLQKKLGQLMRVVLAKSYVEHPQILFGAVGDAFTDGVPLQIGQFESGLEMDDDLGKIYLEGNGGGQGKESYGLVPYFFARHSAIDCYEKRGEKGYLFTIGDEAPYDVIRRDQVKNLIGDTLEADLSLKDVVAEVLERYEWFHIVPTSAGYGDRNVDVWRTYLNERVLPIVDESEICELIAMTIGLNEGSIDSIDQGLRDLDSAGLSTKSIANSTALVAIAGKGNALAKRATASNVPAVAGGTDDDGRI